MSHLAVKTFAHLKEERIFFLFRHFSITKKKKKKKKRTYKKLINLKLFAICITIYTGFAAKIARNKNKY